MSTWTQRRQTSKISNRQHEVRESARSRRRKCRDAESGRRRHHRNPYRTEIFKDIWEEEEIPVDWKTGLIVKLLPKKGNLSLCKNWRGITLLSITSKVFSRVILNRISTALDPMLRKEQAGFRKGRSCGEHIFTLRHILEQCQEWKTPCYVNFIDFEKAFDSIHRESLWCILRHYGIPCKIVTIIKMLYEAFKSKVICG